VDVFVAPKPPKALGVEVLVLPPTPPNAEVLGVAVEGFIAGGLADVTPPKNEPVPLAAAPFAADIPGLAKGGGFFLDDPESPSTAG
jgi:hypothetical protein